MKIGVVVARFETPFIHEGHKDLLNQVIKLSDRLVIFLGCCSPKGTRRDPLDFPTRRLMLGYDYNAEIFPIFDNKSNEVWSENLDKIIKSLYKFDEVTLYGCRDSFLTRYCGNIKTCELEAQNPTHNATELRDMAGKTPINSSDFRKGCIYEAYNRYPISFQAVDIAIINNDEILLGRKPQQKGWRFPGGFVDVADGSLEQAAKRETNEEVPGMEVDDFKYLTSRRIIDWRYKGREDQIMTAFFKAKYIFGTAKAGDDLSEVKWFKLNQFKGEFSHQLMVELLVDEHIPLMTHLLKNL